MKLEIFCMILGGVLWEMGAAYIHFVAKPAFKRWKAKYVKRDVVTPRQGKEIDYKGTAMGFNCSLKEEVK